MRACICSGVEKAATLPAMRACSPSPRRRRAGRGIRRSLQWFVALVAASAPAWGCMTYNMDLDRAKTHYERNQYENALALFRVLEPDIDSFSRADQARYSYLRGMTDYRLSSLAAKGTNVADPKKGFRDNARHWLAVAAAIEKETPGGLNDEEKKRLAETLTDLNHDVYGGAETDKDKEKEKEKSVEKEPEKVK
jgi:hypothetical protein